MREVCLRWGPYIVCDQENFVFYCSNGKMMGNYGSRDTWHEDNRHHDFEIAFYRDASVGIFLSLQTICLCFCFLF